MPRAELAFQFAALGHRELHTRVRDASLADNHAKIVELGIRKENGVEQGGAQFRVEPRRAGFLRKTTEGRTAFQGDQGADLPARAERGALDQGANFFVDLVGCPTAKQASLAEPHQCPTKLRLEHDNDRKRSKLKEFIKEESDARQIKLRTQQTNHDEQADQDERDALEEA